MKRLEFFKQLIGSAAAFFIGTQVVKKKESGELINDLVYVNGITGQDFVGYGHTPDRPIATLDYAVRLCKAGKGNEIYVLEWFTKNRPATW